MPPAPKSPQSTPAATPRRAGAPKAKGAVRAKSGCYTCRIRRKKCDEQPNEHGFCSTCVRLRLECLGFGAKRPDWLRENRNVLQLRDKIKNFLASQGMIKGHSGSGTRSSEQPTVLRLTINDDNSPYHSGSSSSPPIRPQTLVNDDYVPANPRHQTSHTRGSAWVHPTMDQTFRHSNGGHYAAPGSEYDRSPSPQSLNNYPHQLSSSPSLVPPLQNGDRHNRHNRNHPYRNGYIQRPQTALLHHQPGWTPARSSGLSPSYNWDLTHVMDQSFFTQEPIFNPLTTAEAAATLLGGPDGVYPHSDAYGTQNDPTQFFIGTHMNTPWRINDILPFLERYKSEVVTVQYLLGTKFIHEHIANMIAGAQLTCEQQAAALLSRVHFLRFAQPTGQNVLHCNTDVRLHLHEIENVLNNNSMILKPEGAMAALHLISVILFDGGHSGKWQQYLSYAVQFVRNKMRGLISFNNGIEQLRSLGDKDAFIVKTSIWFDVLASVTTGAKPLLLDIIKALFKPGQSGLAELSSAAAAAVAGSATSPSSSSSVPWTPADTTPLGTGTTRTPGTLLAEDKTSMMSPMGCENKVVWALGEISALAIWKQTAKDQGKLSYKDLISQANAIEKELETKYQPFKILSEFPEDDVTAYSRYLVSNIFRTSALLYLHAVVSGGFPHVTQIHMAVEDVMRWIRKIPVRPTQEKEKDIHRTVIRSTVFAFYIVGALTDNEKHRKTITQYLMEEAGTVVGNCQVTLEILGEIWKERSRRCTAAGGAGGSYCNEEVMWREKLRRNNSDEAILLV